MKSIFVSFDEIGWHCLEKILQLGGNVAGIFTLDDERRALMSGNRPFDGLAQKYGVPLHKIKNINDEQALELVKACDPDIAYVIGWSQLVKKEFMSLARYTCVGMHPTLLPKHRGRAPIPWAIIHGLRKTGVTMFHIKEDADNGDIVGQEEIEIEFEDDALSLYKKALAAHVKLIGDYFPLLEAGKAPRIKQDDTKSSCWVKRTPVDGIIDWNTCARNLYDWVRALTEPYPGAFTFHGGRRLVVWKSALADKKLRCRDAGSILDITGTGLLVAAGEGSLLLTDIQFDGGERLQGSKIMGSSLFEKGRILG